jgi:hypothetical protein
VELASGVAVAFVPKVTEVLDQGRKHFKEFEPMDLIGVQIIRTPATRRATGRLGVGAQTIGRVIGDRIGLKGKSEHPRIMTQIRRERKSGMR